MKMTKDMTYGILASRNCQLTKIASSLKEKDIALVTIHGLSDDGIPMMLLTNLNVNDKVSRNILLDYTF